MLLYVLKQHWPEAILAADNLDRKPLAQAVPADLVPEAVIYQNATIASAFDEHGYVPELAGTSIYLIIEEDAVCFTVSDGESAAAEITAIIETAVSVNRSGYPAAPQEGQE